MNSGPPTSGMPVTAAAVEQVIMDAMLAVSPGKSVSRDIDLLQVVDSLGLMMSLAKIQATLNIRLEPRELIGALQSRSIADLALVLAMALKGRSAQPA